MDLEEGSYVIWARMDVASGKVAPGEERTVLERILLLVLKGLIRVFFRTVEVTGSDNVPRDRGGVLVAWHPNGLVDPGLLTASFPGRLVFGAKHGLFRWPLFGRIMRAFGAEPIYRANDDPSLSDEQRRAANQASLAALASRIAGGAYAALFPEGISHDEPYLAPVKTGAARLFLEALNATRPGQESPVIIPVGLHYDEKHLFRTQALVWFYPPIELPPEILRKASASTQTIWSEEDVHLLTASIETALIAAVHPTENWTTHRLINRVRKLVRAERARRAGMPSDRPTLTEKVLGFARVQRGYYLRLASHPKQAAELRRRVEEYDENLTALGFDDHELDQSPAAGSFWFLILTALQFGFVFLLLPPLLLLGYLVNGLPALIVYATSRLMAKEQTVMASHKLIAGTIVFPLTWLGVVLIGAFAHARLAATYAWLPDLPILSGLALAALSIVGAIHILRYQARARQALKNFRVRFRRRKRSELIARMLAARAGIYDDVMQMAEGLVLPEHEAATGKQ